MAKKISQLNRDKIDTYSLIAIVAMLYSTAMVWALSGNNWLAVSTPAE